MVLGVPYTGILGKNTSKTLIPHQRFSWIFDLRIYGGSDPIYGEMVDFQRKGVKNRDFSHISLCAKFNRFFIILGGGGSLAVDTSNLVMEDFIKSTYIR